MLNKKVLSALAVSLVALSLATPLYADSDGDENDDQVSEHETGENDVDHVATSVTGINSGTSTRTSDGHYEVTLPDGSRAAVSTLTTTRIHSKATGTTSVSDDGNGNLHILTGDGYELTVSSAEHNRTEINGVLTQKGWSGVTNNGGHITATLPDGTVESLEADYRISTGQPTGSGQFVQTGDGADALYSDGTYQHYHGAAYDVNELRGSAAQLGYSVNVKSDGTVTASSNGATLNARMSPQLVRGNTVQHGLRTQGGKVIMQYQNGLEQEISLLQ